MRSKLWVLALCYGGLGQAAQEPALFTIGSTPVLGWSTQYQGVELSQPQVSVQEGNSCAYHTLFNGRALFDYVRNQVADFKLLDDQARRRLFGSLESQWRNFVLTRDQADQLGDLVEGGVLEKMVQEFFPQISRDQYALLDSEQHFLAERNAVLNSIDPLVQEQNRNLFWQQLREKIASVTPFSYVFFINTANAFEGEHQNDSHWLMLFFRKDYQGVHHYYVADSINHFRLDSPLITRIVDAIEGRLESPVARALEQEERELEQVIRESELAFEKIQLREEARQLNEVLMASRQGGLSPLSGVATGSESGLDIQKQLLEMYAKQAQAQQKSNNVVVPTAVVMPQVVATEVVPGETEIQRRRRLAAQAAQARAEKNKK